MSNSIIKRIFNPNEMSRALARGLVGKWELRTYVALFFLPIILSFWIPYTPQKFTFASGETLFMTISLLSTLAYYFVVLFLSIDKPNRILYGHSFVSLNIPITFVYMIMNILVAVPFAVMHGSLDIIPITLPHFLLTIPVLFLPSVLMYYFINKIITIKEEDEKTGYVYESETKKSLNLLNPFSAVRDYQEGAISKRGILCRKFILFLSFVLTVSGFFDHSLTYFVYDISSIIFFIVLYFFFPYFINKGTDNQDYFSRLSVINAPIFIDTILIIICVAFIGGIVAGFLHVDSKIIDEQLLIRIADFVLSIASIAFMILAFKKFKQ